MSRIKMLLLSCMAVVVVSAMVSSTAFALFEKTAVECKEPGISTLCLAETEGGKLFEAKGTENITGVKLTAPSTLAVPSLKLTIECKAASATGIIEQPEPLVKSPLLMKLVISFSECVVTGEHAAECKVEEQPIKTKALDGEVLESEPNHVVFTPESGKIFTEITIGNKTGTCPSTIKGVNPVKGEELCILPNNAENKVVQLLACTETKGLEFGTNPAELLANAEFELEDKTPFDSVLA